MKVFITGGAGFIGSAVIRAMLTQTDYYIVNIDSLTYAGNLESLLGVSSLPGYLHEHVDICDAQALARVFEQHKPTGLMHLAAESHVDRSIDGPAEFIDTNITGTFNLLEAARKYYAGLNTAEQKQFRFHHISTDEVYGDLQGTDELFTEQTPYFFITLLRK